jgi:hypothetical protein
MCAGSRCLLHRPVETIEQKVGRTSSDHTFRVCCIFKVIFSPSQVAAPRPIGRGQCEGRETYWCHWRCSWPAFASCKRSSRHSRRTPEAATPWPPQTTDHRRISTDMARRCEPAELYRKRKPGEGAASSLRQLCAPGTIAGDERRRRNPVARILATMLRPRRTRERVIDGPVFIGPATTC